MTTTMTRTDIHRPSAVEFDPENYIVRGFADFHDTDGYRPVQVVSALVDEGYSFRSAPHGSGQCSHCGTHLRYAALLSHEPTKTLMYVGETCLDNRFEGTKADFDAMRKQAAAKAEQTRREGKAADFFAAHPDMVDLTYIHNISVAGGEREWTTQYNYEETFTTEAEAAATLKGDYDGVIMGYKRGTTWDEQVRMGKWTSVLQDMGWKVQKYGSLSDAQVAFARKMLGWLSEAEEKRVEREAAKQAILDSGVALTAGRQTIEGTVLSVKWKSNDFGGAYKMTVDLGNGTKVWGSLPSAHEDEVETLEGKSVRFVGTVEVKDGDPTFGFFKRPAKFEII